MLTQLLVGSILICASIVLMVGFISVAIASLTRIGAWLVAGNPIVRTMISLSGVVLWLLAALTVVVWIWAGAFYILGLFETFEESLYLAAVAFTTLGFGDVVIGQEWRLLSGLIAANGLILFSLVTAFLIEFLSQLRSAQNGKG
ncbi:ion channel [Altererythrobacter sp.]|uniref:ion channel n=1 Tax=Altererythrobacter sp. TaxID=1872480 RepID=UPI001B1A4F6E|nr:ion channel [Altererythrobacter sp.]MBO6610155.1 two pore domain potassium channel family protein [Altererythrobacter sp.]MBO6642774.1 two pore domain potassium channel family protein [Altererythrobacter sp.]MBO6708718.1 two pore domain potassium channel family protein [Altererythrobacter sp.]